MRLINATFLVVLFVLLGWLLYGRYELAHLKNQLEQIEQKFPATSDTVQIAGAEWVTESILRFRIALPEDASIRLIADTHNLEKEVVGQIDATDDSRYFVAWLAASNESGWERLQLFIEEYSFGGKIREPNVRQLDESGLLGRRHEWYGREEIAERTPDGIPLLQLLKGRFELTTISLHLVPMRRKAEVGDAP